MMSDGLNNNNKQNLDNLYQILVQESALCDNLISLLEKKQESIIKGQIEELQDYTAKEQSIVRQANAFSDTRQYLVKKILDDSDNKEKIISLSNFLQMTNRTKEKKWSSIKDKLDAAVQKIRKINFENHELLQTSIAFVKEMIRVFLPKDKDSNQTYSKNGKMTDAEKRQQVLNCQI